MTGITLLLDLWRKNQSFSKGFYSARNYESSWFLSASATVASFAAGTSFASRDSFGFRTQIAYCDVGAAISEDYISNTRSVPERYFYHDSLKYSTKNYNIELKPLLSAFELKSFTMITLRSFLMFYLPLLDPHASMEQEDDDDFLRDNQDDLHGRLVVSFKKSILQIMREVTIVTTRRILERIAVHHVSRRMAWKLLKDAPTSAARKAVRKMPTLVYFFSVSRTTFRGYMLGVAASWLVQVGIKLCQFFTFNSKKRDDNIDNAERARILRQKIFVATVKCNASLICASIGAGIGATLFSPSLGQWIGCICGDLAGPAIVAVCADQVFHLNL
ncbi:PREDICTED: uncharacterized protein LOC109344991 [Lupinus angustifolius]|uniref:uncharacterized protein LOC109344991 n=1 Tax=Lupinus angustifolius TaxID=3871 RepID=UPI00092F46EE|nr:PREDICTED: uncharacterized protein LOC109344991 [Lupinus angustifolius]XP_019439279.1 PREDICTED: uncharacterized protein LOC109344991 [Lupinus angustifolius]